MQKGKSAKFNNRNPGRSLWATQIANHPFSTYAKFPEN